MSRIDRMKDNPKINGNPAEIVRLDVHDWFGNLIHRIRGKTTEKKVGVAILDLVRDLYGLTEQDIVQLTQKLREEELTPEDRLREQWKRPIKWRHK